ncbi:MAG: FAD-binding oxidoreductase, partial [Gammaproteobacteria bacterium]|nr:FAD-binding oxidoreductase [Gammaproteobacteria bacterium]
LAAGARIHEGLRIEGLERSGARWRAQAGRARIEAEHVVLATNGYTDELWPGLRRSVVPVFSTIVATAPLEEALARRILPGRSVLYESGSITVYYRIDGAGRLLIGGRGPMHEIDGPGEIGHLIAYARRLWPRLVEAAWTHGWGGRIAMTRDHYPHLHEPAGGVLAALGYNGRGVALATALGAELAKRVLDPSADPPLPVTRLQPIRLHALWPLAVKAVVLRGRIADRFGR